MNKLFSKIAALSVGLAMAVGVGVAVGSQRGAVEVKATQASTTIAAYASANGWVNEQKYGEIVLDSNITLSTGTSGNNGKYYSTNNDWRLYQADGGVLTITSASGELTSVTLTFTIKDSGTISYNSTALTSETAMAVSGASAELVVGASSGTKGKIIITAISVEYNGGPTKTLDDITDVSGTVSAIAGASEWTIDDASATGTLSEEVGQNVTSYVDFSVVEDVPSTAGTPTVHLRATKKSTVTGDATFFEKEVTATVNEDPFAALTKVASKDDVTALGIYAFSYDGSRFAKNSVASSGFPYPASGSSELGYYKLDGQGHLARIAYEEGEWKVKKYINNSSGTGLTEADSSTGASVWVLANHVVDDEIVGVYLQNSSNGNRFLGLNTNDATTATSIKAYATNNFVTSYLPVYLYELPQAEITSIVIKTSPKNEYVEGNKFDPTGLVITVNYSEGDPVDVPYEGNVSQFTFNPNLETDLTQTDVAVRITYGGVYVDFPITVSAAPEIARLEVNTEGAGKLEYALGSTLVTTGIVVNGFDDEDQLIIEDISHSKLTFTPNVFEDSEDLPKLVTVNVSYHNEEADTYAYGSFEVTVFDSLFSKVTSVSQLWEGQRVVIGNVAETFIAKTWESGNSNVKAQEATFDEVNHTINVAEYDSYVYTINRYVKDGNLVYSFRDINKRYLAATGANSSNKLEAVETLNSKCYFTIAIDDGAFTITCTADNTSRNTLKYNANTSNPNSQIFSCYESAGGGADASLVALYALDISSESVKNAFENNVMHMNDYDPELTGEGEGWCKDEEHAYYAKAKAVWNALSSTERGSVSEQARARLAAWAAANHDVYDGGTGAISSSPIGLFGSTTNPAPIVIIIVSTLVITSVGLVLILRKKKVKE